MSSPHVLILLSVALAVVVVAVLATALIQIQRGLASTSSRLSQLVDALTTVESDHLKPLEPALEKINAQFDVILGALPGIARKAAVVAERRPR
jgi:hypothetical protein